LGVRVIARLIHVSNETFVESRSQDGGSTLPSYPEQELTREVIAAAMEVHRALGPGLLESAYHSCLCRELQLRNLNFVQQIDLPLSYKGVKLDCGYRIDLIVSDRIIVELKSVQEVLPVHEAQLLTYMRLTAKGVGLLINFNVAVLKKGIKRRVL
jgi:GxxExxY protein